MVEKVCRLLAYYNPLYTFETKPCRWLGGQKVIYGNALAGDLKLPEGFKVVKERGEEYFMFVYYNDRRLARYTAF